MEIGEKVRKFIEGYNPLERIVNIECDYNDEFAYVIYKNELGKKYIRKMDFKPFVWVKNSACLKMCEGNRKVLMSLLEKYNIGVKKLQSENKVGKNHERLTNSYKYLFYAKSRMSWSVFQRFFTIAKTPIYPKQPKDKKDSNPSDEKEFLAVAPVEQFMIANGIRLFKGYENYDELKRMAWDIETTGLNPEVDVLDQIGIRTNKGFETIITVEGESKEEKKKNEIKSIRQFLEHIADEKPDILFGHNSEVFDFNFLMTRCAKHGIDFSELSLDFLTHPIYKKKKQSVLKLGGEVEYFYPTCLWGTTILDSMHAVRRAQASNSNIKSARLKYIADYLKLKKPNRVYVQGDKIGEIWRETKPIYAFNNDNGDYYIPTQEKPLQPKYEMVSGKYIVERYLLDDIWETDKVELTLNQANFLIAKILPTTFQRACTMGTAGIWKLILLAWSYENDLAIPSFTPSHAFVGGLSRLLKTGYAANVAKLDYNSLYPSIMLTWWVRSCVDTTDSILYMLEYVLSNREKYKALKGSAGKEANKLKDYLDEHKDELTEEEIIKIKNDITHWKAEKEANDNKQLPLKTLGNSIFGSFGAPNIFPLGDQISAEFVTCTGRMALRLMIHHFKELGYEPIVGDSVLGDTPLFVKYNDSNLIDIKSIEEIFNDGSYSTDALGRKYNTDAKNYKVLCRSGWSEVSYVYKHKTDKTIYTVIDDDTSVEVTEDHSLFDDKQTEIKPRDITEETKLEYYQGEICGDMVNVSPKEISLLAKCLINGTHEKLNYRLLNMNKESTKLLLNLIGKDFVPSNKVCLAQIMYLKNKIQN